MERLKIMFMLVVLDFISKWYEDQKFDQESKRLMMHRFKALNNLRGDLRDELERL